MTRGVPLWSRAPFLRLLPPLITGIYLQWQIGFRSDTILIFFVTSILLFCFFQASPAFSKFRLAFLNGLFLGMVLCGGGALLVYCKDIRNNKAWFANHYDDGVPVLATIIAPPVEKPASWKAVAKLNTLVAPDTLRTVEGSIFIYFKKDISREKISYGTQIIFSGSLATISNTGNPGAFDYQRYCQFQGITHQVFLTEKDFRILPGSDVSWFRSFLFSARERIVKVLEKYIPEPQHQGLAAALLIGYKDSLDKELVQSYANTGVVHVIAISGLHLGLIYWLLLVVFRPFRRTRSGKLISGVLIISFLWLFSLLAGAQPSVLRSALMFTCIILGESLSRNTSIYNSLAASAFLLLCHNPFWLWDAGFQLSYAAVLSIVIFLKPVYNLFYLKNKMLDYVWKLNALTIAAQILTTPVSLHHFHQFPNYFLLANLVAVPLSSLVLLLEIALCIIQFIPFAASLAGEFVGILIGFMNNWIGKIENLPFATWQGIEVTAMQSLCLFVMIAGFSFWLRAGQRQGLFLSLAALIVFSGIRCHAFIKAGAHHQLIAYNIPRQTVIDLVQGRSYLSFTGSADTLDRFEEAFYILPTRRLLRLTRERKNFLKAPGYSFRIGEIMIMIANEGFHLGDKLKVAPPDILFITGAPGISLEQLVEELKPKKLVSAGSLGRRQLKLLRKICEKKNIPFHPVSEKGAFVFQIE